MIQSVDRAARILETVRAARRIAPSQLAARLDLPVSTTRGIAKTLVDHDLLVQDPGSAQYALGPALLLMGNVYLDTLELRSHVAPWSAELARSTGHVVRTAVLVGSQMVVVRCDEPDGGTGAEEVGMQIPVHASALGRAVLAFSPDVVRRLPGLGRPAGPAFEPGLPAMTGATLVDPDRLRAALELTVRTGLAEERDESVLGEAGAAAAVFDASGVAGAVALVVDSAAWPVSAEDVARLRRAARAVSRSLGAARWPADRPAA